MGYYQHIVDHPTTAAAALLCAVYLFYKALQPKDNHRPPLVPYRIPWLGSAIAIGKDPDGFFRRATERFGPIFRVVTIGQETAYVTSPSLIAAIYRNAKTFEFSSIRLDMSINVFSSPKAETMSGYMSNEFFDAHHRALSPKNVPLLLGRYSEFAHEQLVQAINNVNGRSTGLLSFIIMPAYIAAAFTIFGKRFPAEQSYRNFRKFDNQFMLIAAGVPRFLLREASQGWANIITIVQDYIKDTPDNAEDISDLVRIVLEARADAGWSNYMIATVLATDLWALEANAMWAAYWTIALMIQQPKGLTPLVNELDDARRAWTAAHPTTPLSATTFKQFIDESPLALLTSAIHEALRVSTSTFSIRVVTEPTELAGYTFAAGDRLICSTRSVHLDEEIHRVASEFVADRYVDGQSTFTKEGKRVPNHSMPFGGGVSMCEGRHFALGELKLYLAMLLTYADIKLDPTTSARPKLNLERLGTGIMPPVGDLNVFIQRRGTDIDTI